MKIRTGLLGTILLVCFCVMPAIAAAQQWNSLSPTQQLAMAPLAQQWGSLTEKEQRHLLKTADHYADLNPEQKQRFHERLLVWIKLTPEQRDAARNMYRAFEKVPAATREEVKRLVNQEQQKKAQQAASAVPSTE